MRISEQIILKTFEQIINDPQLKRFMNLNLSVPEIFCGNGEIRLFILGQDPTVKNSVSRTRINTVLNLDKTGSLRSYINKICEGLGLDLVKNVYATNFLKNFFILPPTQFKDKDLVTKFADIWFPILQEELALFKKVPIISLGQPVLSLIVKGDAPKLVRDYWGYHPEWKIGKISPFIHILPGANKLDRTVFPFPHQPSITKQFYYSRFTNYLEYMRGILSF